MHIPARRRPEFDEARIYEYKPAEPKEPQHLADIGDAGLGIDRMDSVGPLGLGAFITPSGEIKAGQWGMIPPHSKTRIPYTRVGERMSTNNARRETIASAWTFAPAWKSGQRCIVSAWYWVEPYWGMKTRNIWWKFGRADGRVAGLAGFYSHWKGPMTGESVPNFTLITQNCDAPPLLSLMHRPDKAERRSVVLVEPEDWGTWLNGTAAQAEALIHLPPPGTLAHGAENPQDEQLLPPELLAHLKSLG